jgi:uncharacterized protein (TIGR00369 family)
MSTEPGSERTRTFSWEDPLIGARAAPEMSGIDYLRAMAGGRLPPPPIAPLIGMEFVEVEDGRAVFALEPAEYHYNTIGTVHGGVTSTLFDSALGCAVHSMLPAGTGYTTLELKVNFLRPLTRETGRVLCEGKVLHVGGRVATAEARLLDGAGRLYGHATTTCMIFRGPEDGRVRPVGKGD